MSTFEVSETKKLASEKKYHMDEKNEDNVQKSLSIFKTVMIEVTLPFSHELKDELDVYLDKVSWKWLMFLSQEKLPTKGKSLTMDS